MTTFTVSVTKDYHRNDDLKTVNGTLEVEADSQVAAEALVENWMDNAAQPLQTADERINWDEDFLDLVDEGWTYSDFTFEVVKE